MPDSPGASLEIRGAVKRYEEVTALGGISVLIHPGEFLTLLGPSGSGKTTTLNAIAGFIDLTEGEIYLDGAPIAPIPTHKRNIGVIFQNYALFPHMTAASNIVYALKQRGVPRAERDRRVAGVLDLVGLGDIGHRYPRELSGGQQQRVALARAIVFNPRLLLMDEPLGALDRKLREGLQREIKSIHRDLGITFVYVTHDQEEALALSDRIAVFREGWIEQIGTPGELYEQPRNRFVAEFMGESNVLSGAVRDGGAGRAWFDADDLDGPLSIEGPVPAGGSCYVVRPQKISIAKGAGAGENQVPGRVTDVSYLGATRRVTVDCGGTTFLVREDAHLSVPASVDDEVFLGWGAQDGLLVPEDSPVLPQRSPQSVVLSNNPTDGRLAG